MTARAGRTALLAAALLLSGPSAFAILGIGTGQDAGQPGAFLNAAMNARSVAMGGAYTGIADDATAPFWNASGLAQLQRYDVVTNYSRLGEDASIGSGAFAAPTSRFGTFSINYVSLRSGSFRRRDENNQDLGSFENSASALLLSQGFDLSGHWSAGYTVKAVRQSIDRFSDTGYGADLGLLFRPHPRWQVGFALQNVVQPSLKLSSEAEKLPTESLVGAKFSPLRHLTLAADASFVGGNAPKLGVGLEWLAVDLLALRVGANDNELTTGIGLFLGDAGFDYAFGVPVGNAVGDELGNTQRVSFHLRFGANVTAATFHPLAAKREDQRRDIVKQEEVTDRVAVLRGRMATWDGHMDPTTFAQVQSAQRSLRGLDFTDPVKALEAQAYIVQFQGRFVESAHLFEQLAELRPGDRRIRRDAKIAHRRMTEHPESIATASVYDAMEKQERDGKIAPAKIVDVVGDAKESVGELPKPPLTGHADASPPRSQVAVLAPELAPAPAAVAVSTAVTVPAVAGPPVKPEVSEAVEKFAAGDYVASHVLTRRVLELDPDDRVAARQAILTNAVVSAQATLTDPKATVDLQAVTRKVDLSMALYDKGLRLREGNWREHALAILEEAVYECPANYLARDLIKKINFEIEDEQWRKLVRDSRADR